MRTRTLAWMLLAGSLLAQPAWADLGDHAAERQQEREQRRHERDHGGPRSGPSEAARKAQERNGGGRVLGVSPTDEGYRVKLLKQGEVRVLMVPSE